MANLLSMAKVDSVHTLHQSGHSNREIARLLRIDRSTVGKYVHEFQNQPNAPTGETAQESDESPHRSGPESGCRAFHEIILKKLDAGLSLLDFAGMGSRFFWNNFLKKGQWHEDRSQGFRHRAV